MDGVIAATILAGSGVSLVLALKDENGQPLNMTGVTDARATISSEAGSSDAVTKTPTIDMANSTLTVSLTGGETNGLVLGILLLEAIVLISGQWYSSKRVYVEVVARVAVNP